MDINYKEFYDKQHSNGGYAPCVEGEFHAEHKYLRNFLKNYGLRKKRCLEIGCARGAFQDMVENYTAVDITYSLKTFIHSPNKFVLASAENLPFKKGAFDAIWSVYCFEHVPDVMAAFIELRRVVKPGGYFFLRPAWNVPRWVATGVSVKAYKDLPLRLKILKFILPLRNHRFFKAGPTILRRILFILKWKMGKQPSSLCWKKLEPDYEVFWTSDSDACSCIDLVSCYCWFRDRGDECLEPQSLIRAIFSPSKPLIIRKADNDKY